MIGKDLKFIYKHENAFKYYLRNLQHVTVKSMYTGTL